MNALDYVEIDHGIHQEKNKVARNEKRKRLHGFHIPKIWQLLKRCARSFHQAQTSYF